MLALGDDETFLAGKRKKKVPRMAGLKIMMFMILTYASLTFTAFNPFFPSCKSKVTSSFSLILSFNPDECTKYSFGEFASLMNPNPLDSL